MIALLRFGIPALVGALLMIPLSSAYHYIFVYPEVRYEARAGMVSQFEKEALEARLHEETRRRIALEGVRADYEDQIADLKANELDLMEHTEMEILNYEEKLAQLGRSCRLSDADIEWLRKP